MPEITSGGGTTICPICAWPEPHSHTDEEIADRQFVAGARRAFESKASRNFMLQEHFDGGTSGRTGYWWGFDAEQARTTQEGDAHGWAQRDYPAGPYSNRFVEVMWQHWLLAWKMARGWSPPERTDD